MVYKTNKLKSITKGLMASNIIFPAAYILFSAEMCTSVANDIKSNRIVKETNQFVQSDTIEGLHGSEDSADTSDALYTNESALSSSSSTSAGSSTSGGSVGALATVSYHGQAPSTVSKNIPSESLAITQGDAILIPYKGSSDDQKVQKGSVYTENQDKIIFPLSINISADPLLTQPQTLQDTFVVAQSEECMEGVNSNPQGALTLPPSSGSLPMSVTVTTAGPSFGPPPPPPPPSSSGSLLMSGVLSTANCNGNASNTQAKKNDLEKNQESSVDPCKTQFINDLNQNQESSVDPCKTQLINDLNQNVKNKKKGSTLNIDEQLANSKKNAGQSTDNMDPALRQAFARRNKDPYESSGKKECK